MKRYRIDNWAEYNASLINRGRLTIWMSSSAIEGWFAENRGHDPGRPRVYSDDAILMMLMLRERYHLPLRAVQGFVESAFEQIGIDLPVPSYTQICRRAKRLGELLKRLIRRGGATDLVFDSTGLRVYGEGEWKVRTHGKSKRRTWRKLHIAIDPTSQQIVLAELTDRDGGDSAIGAEMLDEIKGQLGHVWGDGGYDGVSFRQAVFKRCGQLIVPPPKNARYKGATHGCERKRDASIAEIVGLGGDEAARKLWKKLKGYHRRSLVETAMYRIKQILGGNLRARCPSNQTVESLLKCFIINKMSDLGLPRGRWVELAG